MVKGKNNKTSGMKTIPRRAICFAARLDLDTEAEELTNFLTDAGLQEVYCKKMESKNGKKFYTAAFRVSCRIEDQNLLFDENTWPMGVEVREWTYQQNN